ncbi:MAG TPA: DUF6691 family protein [Cyclobacteriaceae bacterium]|jgi:uncharacterized membrane protein YedE/YeeE
MISEIQVLQQREAREMDQTKPSVLNRVWNITKYILAGAWFGVALVKGEIVSWYRLQEMFRFESFHMYGVIGSAVAVGALSIVLIRKSGLKGSDGNVLQPKRKTLNRGTVIGGMLFGMGWAMTGACPGSLYALAGAGFPAMVVIIAAALIGTFLYGIIRK